MSMQTIRKSVRRPLSLLALLFAVGTIGYHLIEGAGQAFYPTPEAGMRLEHGDILTVLGTRKQIDGFEKVATSPASHEVPRT